MLIISGHEQRKGWNLAKVMRLNEDVICKGNSYCAPKIAPIRVIPVAKGLQTPFPNINLHKDQDIVITIRQRMYMRMFTWGISRMPVSVFYVQRCEGF